MDVEWQKIYLPLHQVDDSRSKTPSCMHPTVVQATIIQPIGDGVPISHIRHVRDTMKTPSRSSMQNKGSRGANAAEKGDKNLQKRW
jgi:hypothetical protein